MVALTKGLLVAQAPKQQSVTLVLSITEAELVVKALGKLPYEESAQAIQNIVTQAQRQLQPPPSQPPADAQKKADSIANKKKN